MPNWPKTAVQIMNEISDANNLDWDTDANINVLTQFIEENFDPASFISHVQACAENDRLLCFGEVARPPGDNNPPF